MKTLFAGSDARMLMKLVVDGAATACSAATSSGRTPAS